MSVELLERAAEIATQLPVGEAVGTPVALIAGRAGERALIGALAGTGTEILDPDLQPPTAGQCTEFPDRACVDSRGCADAGCYYTRTKEDM